MEWHCVFTFSHSSEVMPSPRVRVREGREEGEGRRG